MLLRWSVCLGVFPQVESTLAPWEASLRSPVGALSHLLSLVPEIEPKTCLWLFVFRSFSRALGFLALVGRRNKLCIWIVSASDESIVTICQAEPAIFLFVSLATRPLLQTRRLDVCDRSAGALHALRVGLRGTQALLPNSPGAPNEKKNSFVPRARETK